MARQAPHAPSCLPRFSGASSSAVADHCQTLLQQAICCRLPVRRETHCGTVGMMTSQRSGGGGARSAGSAHRRALLEDLAFSREEIPSLPHGVLEQHQDEVWLVQFAHGSAKLASASKDGVVIVWGLDAIGAAAAAADGQTAAQQRQCDAGGEQHGKALCGHTERGCPIVVTGRRELADMQRGSDDQVMGGEYRFGAHVQPAHRVGHIGCVAPVRSRLPPLPPTVVCAWNVRRGVEERQAPG